MPTNLTIVGLTGGIATGKSTCCRCLAELSSEVVLFDADRCVASLYDDPSVQAELVEYFGSDLRCLDGSLDRGLLRNRAFSDSESKRFLEQVFHPRVRKECLALLDETAKRGASRLFVADIPLLFESGFDFGQSANLLVATSQKTQVSRLKSRNAWDDDTVDGVLRSQMPVDAKLKLADVVFWNEGPRDILNSQCCRYLASLGLMSHSS